MANPAGSTVGIFLARVDRDRGGAPRTRHDAGHRAVALDLRRVRTTRSPCRAQLSARLASPGHVGDGRCRTLRRQRPTLPRRLQRPNATSRRTRRGPEPLGLATQAADLCASAQPHNRRPESVARTLCARKPVAAGSTHRGHPHRTRCRNISADSQACRARNPKTADAGQADHDCSHATGRSAQRPDVFAAGAGVIARTRLSATAAR